MAHISEVRLYLQLELHIWYLLTKDSVQLTDDEY